MRNVEQTMMLPTSDTLTATEIQDLQKRKPRVLRIETGLCSANVRSSGLWTRVLDYEVYSRVPRWWRLVEQMLRLDLVLAYRARTMADDFDIVWADSEKVGFPLTLLCRTRPLVVVGHHCASRKKRWLFRLLKITDKWAGVGYWSEPDRDFFRSYYQVPSKRLFNAATPEFDCSSSFNSAVPGPIISTGVSKRDYHTLVSALSELPGYETQVYPGSRYGDVYRKSKSGKLPSWIHFMQPVPHGEMTDTLRRARFIVVPLEESTQFNVGLTAIAEAGAAGKAVVATQTPGTSSYVEHGVTGLLVPPRDPGALRAAIRELWENPKLAQRMGAAGRERVRLKFDQRKANHNIGEFLKSIFAEYQAASATSREEVRIG